MIKKQSLLTLSLSLGALLFTPTLGHACSCRGETDLQSRFIRAQDVVIAEVTNTKLVKTVHKEHDLEYIVADIKIIEDLKRQPEHNHPLSRVIDLVPAEGNCSIGLTSGVEYVLFIDDHHYEDEETEMGWLTEDHYVGRCTGSKVINYYSINFNQEHTQLKDLAMMTKNGELEPSAGKEQENEDCEKDAILPDRNHYND